MNISFHLVDNCNLNCVDCHWLSGPIKYYNPQNYSNYINWINENKPTQIRLTGGEPMLYPGINESITNIPDNIIINLFTNGTELNDIGDNKNKFNINLKISINRKVSDNFINDIKSDLTHTNIKFFSFNNHPGCTKFKNQLTESNNIKSLIGTSILCTPVIDRFTIDGYQYYCEKGIRTKNLLLRTGNNLWNKYKPMRPIRCKVDESCLSCFIGEQKYSVIN